VELLRFQYVHFWTAILDFTRNEFSQFFCLWGPQLHMCAKFQHNSPMRSWVISDSTNFQSLIFTGNFEPPIFLELGGATCIKFEKKIGPSSALPAYLLGLRYVVLLLNWSKIDAKFSQFVTPVKIKGGGEMSKSRFQAQPRTKSPRYFSSGAVVRARRLNTSFRPKFTDSQKVRVLQRWWPNYTKFLAESRHHRFPSLF